MGNTPNLHSDHHAQAPSPAMAGIDYRRAPVATWVTVASTSVAPHWHEMRKLLTRHGIESRLGESSGQSATMDLQVLSTEVAWARDLLDGHSAPGPALIYGDGMVSHVHAHTLDDSTDAAPKAIADYTRPNLRDARVTLLVLTTLWVLLVGLVLFVILLCCIHAPS